MVYNLWYDDPRYITINSVDTTIFVGLHVSPTGYETFKAKDITKFLEVITDLRAYLRVTDMVTLKDGQPYYWKETPKDLKLEHIKNSIISVLTPSFFESLSEGKVERRTVQSDIIYAANRYLEWDDEIDISLEDMSRILNSVYTDSGVTINVHNAIIIAGDDSEAYIIEAEDCSKLIKLFTYMGADIPERVLSRDGNVVSAKFVLKDINNINVIETLQTLDISTDSSDYKSRLFYKIEKSRRRKMTIKAPEEFLGYSDVEARAFVLAQMFMYRDYELSGIDFPNAIKLFRELLSNGLLVSDAGGILYCKGCKDLDFILILKREGYYRIRDMLNAMEKAEALEVTTYKDIDYNNTKKFRTVRGSFETISNIVLGRSK